MHWQAPTLLVLFSPFLPLKMLCGINSKHVLAKKNHVEEIERYETKNPSSSPTITTAFVSNYNRLSKDQHLSKKLAQSVRIILFMSPPLSVPALSPFRTGNLV